MPLLVRHDGDAYDNCRVHHIGQQLLERSVHGALSASQSGHHNDERDIIAQLFDCKPAGGLYRLCDTELYNRDSEAYRNSNFRQYINDSGNHLVRWPDNHKRNIPVCNFTFSSAGSSNVVATYSGDSNFSLSFSAPAGDVQVVATGSTALVLTSTPSNTTANQQVTFTATVTATPSGGAGFPAPWPLPITGQRSADAHRFRLCPAHRCSNVFDRVDDCGFKHHSGHL